MSANILNPPINRGVLQKLQVRYPQLQGEWQVLRNGLGSAGRGCLFVCAHQRYFVKRFDRSAQAKDAILDEHGVIRFLASRKYPTPAVLANVSGETVTWVEQWPYAIYEAAKGEDIYSDAPYYAPYLRPEHASSAGAALARAHQLLNSYAQPPRKSFTSQTSQFKVVGKLDLGQSLEELVSAWPTLRDYVRSQPEYMMLLDLLDPYNDQLKGQVDQLPQTVIHGEFVKSNLFFIKDQVSAVSDFDLCNLAPRVFDLCVALQPIAFPWDQLLQGKGKVEERDARAFLAGYHAIQPLTPQELAALPAVLATCRFEFNMSVLGRMLEAGETEQAHEQWEFLIRVQRWFLTRPEACHFLLRPPGGTGYLR